MSGPSELTPAGIVTWLDRHVVGQAEAKRTVAIALRNRYRRRLVEGPIRAEIYPSNIIMMGPTGIGKTEIARRLANLVGAPFVKVEATKYTETGYVGRDVESMVRDLVRQAVRLEADRARAGKREEAEKRSLEKLGRALVEQGLPDVPESRLMTMLASGKLDSRDVEVALPEEAQKMEVVPFMPGSGIDADFGEGLKQAIQKIMGSRRRKSRVAVGEARQRLLEEELNSLVERVDYVQSGLRMAQEEGIIFIDEIDKIIGSEGGGGGPDVSRLGVQRDLLPLLEGSTVQTRYGSVRTDHILFIAAGAFHGSSPSDLIPELQGRFPLRVSLDPLGEDDLFRVLTEPENCLLRQMTELLRSDGVELRMDDEACREVARVACALNTATEDIGARRLRPVMAYLLDDLLFGAPDLVRGRASIDRKSAAGRLAKLMADTEQLDYIL
ncbi:ATP-dependent protease ATPase subunit HslU [Candidatus Fermentibacterales bacterium]|nr:ATP-dependent protease ATPase subunit HslU [Candidatus Fermentibacterales bacterium]